MIEPLRVAEHCLALLLCRLIAISLQASRAQELQLNEEGLRSDERRLCAEGLGCGRAAKNKPRSAGDEYVVARQLCPEMVQQVRDASMQVPTGAPGERSDEIEREYEPSQARIRSRSITSPLVRAETSKVSDRARGASSSA